MKNQNIENNPFPTFDLFPRVARTAKFISRIIRNTNVPVPLYLSDHYDPTHFNAVSILAEEPQDGEAWQPELDFTAPKPSFGWNSEGTYIDPAEY